jgi:D-alanyl-D-alanine carboxypeptidase
VLAVPAFVALVLAPSAHAGTAQTLDRALDRVVKASGAPPGLFVLISRDGRQEFRRRGVADVNTRRRPALSDHYRIASMTKAFNGAVALALVAEGKLELDDRIGERLPGLLPRANHVTLAQALQHTGGLRDYIRSPEFVRRVTANPAAYMSPRELVGFVRDAPLRFRPGSRYEYSNTDSIVAALMAEAMTRRSYEQLLATYVYRPLGLRQTSLPRTVRLPRPNLRGYEIGPGKPPEDVSQTINPAAAWASAGMVSTAPDVNTFFRAYAAGRLFDAATRRRQLLFRAAFSSPPGPGANAAGLGIFRYRMRCGTVYGHTGSFPGYHLFAAAVPDGRRSVVFTVNAQIVPRERARERVVAALIRSAQESAVCHALSGIT